MSESLNHLLEIIRNNWITLWVSHWIIYSTDSGMIYWLYKWVIESFTWRIQEQLNYFMNESLNHLLNRLRNNWMTLWVSHWIIYLTDSGTIELLYEWVIESFTWQSQEQLTDFMSESLNHLLDRLRNNWMTLWVSHWIIYLTDPGTIELIYEWIIESFTWNNQEQLNYFMSESLNHLLDKFRNDLLTL